MISNVTKDPHTIPHSRTPTSFPVSLQEEWIAKTLIGTKPPAQTELVGAREPILGQCSPKSGLNGRFAPRESWNANSRSDVGFSTMAVSDRYSPSKLMTQNPKSEPRAS